MEAIYKLAEEYSWSKKQLDMLYKKKRLTKAEYESLISKLDLRNDPEDRCD